MSMTRRVPLAIASCLAAAASVALAPMATAQSDQQGSGAPLSSLTQARQALAVVDSIFATSSVRARAASVPSDLDATMALRDLRLRLADLPSDERQTAQAYFARPSDTSTDGLPKFPVGATRAKQCSATVPVCVHYVSGVFAGADAASASDVSASVSVLENVYNRIITQGGYRTPKSDASSSNNEGDGRLDVYLQNLGDNGLYGYCTSDDPSNNFQVSAYCAIDNDFAEYSTPPAAARGVTVAHEFFHAVQFAYDISEDNWFMEGTAAWIEDEIYDDVDDNLIYIDPSYDANPLTNPGTPLDRYGRDYANYGAWTFWKKLTETFPDRASTNLPIVMRRIWDRAADPVVYSTKALTQQLGAQNYTFARMFRQWGVGNRFPELSYSEGRVNNYPKPPLSGSFALTASARGTGGQRATLDHMTNNYYAFTPEASMARNWVLRFYVDGPSTARGTRATVIVYRKDGRVVEVPVLLDRSGVGRARAPFNSTNINRVELTLTNASNRFQSCFGASDFSCGGQPMDDNLTYIFGAKAIPKAR